MRFAVVFFGLIVGVAWALTAFGATDHPLPAMLAGCLALTLLVGVGLVLVRLWKPLLIVGIPAFVTFCVYAWFAPGEWPAAESSKVIAEYSAKGVGIVVGGIVGLFILMVITSGSSNSSGSGSRRDSRMFYEKHYSEWDATDHGQFRHVQDQMRNRR